MNPSTWAQWVLVAFVVLQLIVLVGQDFRSYERKRDGSQFASHLVISIVLSLLLAFVLYRAGAFSEIMK